MLLEMKRTAEAFVITTNIGVYDYFPYNKLHLRLKVVFSPSLIVGL